ncbi:MULTISPECIES: hypothetical protein [unclassified Microbacterium]|uniref:hypothetical protein n=1 Tax=unclassified Microbacterium TaxID=2609290 RepID=UPI00214B19F9|nr:MULTISPECIES: hypothetical protein [unclassified Microbacterium]MCR2808412.1 hypothetical protein [Microbacterium sp. zg.B185]WIM19143.1 hypothetical protein QNO12_16430 [Microbacterium sp. zg-B185]
MIWGAFAAHGMTEEQRIKRRDAVALGTEGNVWDIASAAMLVLTDREVDLAPDPRVDGGGLKPRNHGQAGTQATGNDA